jgi:putative ABC transport system permease protein
VVLSALGIAIGIAAMVSVVGIGSSSQAQLQGVLDRLGTNLLAVSPGKSLSGETIPLPASAVGQVGRVPGVLESAGTGVVRGAHVYRNDKIPELQTRGLDVRAGFDDVPGILGGGFLSGSWLHRSGTNSTPSEKSLGSPSEVVLGSHAASALGVDRVTGVERVWIGGSWWTVVGILEPLTLAKDLDSSVFVPVEAAASRLGFDGVPTQVYARADPAHLDAVRAVLPRAANPGAEAGATVSRPSDALEAQQASEASFTGLLLGLGLVALLVGGIGVANTMVITVLERRAEIGVRRALGARRRHIRDQFLIESLLLALLGGACGVALGSAVTVVFSAIEGWPPTVPIWVVAGGVGSTVAIGGLSGIYPACRAASVPPTSALAAA